MKKHLYKGMWLGLILLLPSSVFAEGVIAQVEEVIAQIAYTLPSAQDVMATQTLGGQYCAHKGAAIIGYHLEQSPSVTLIPQEGDVDICEAEGQEMNVTLQITPFNQCSSIPLSADQITSAPSRLFADGGKITVVYQASPNYHYSMKTQDVASQFCLAPAKDSTALHFVDCRPELNEPQRLLCCWTESGDSAGCSF